MFKLTPQSLQSLRVAINAALAPVAEDYGVTLVAAGCTYRPGAFTFRLEGSVLGADGEDLGTLQSLPHFLQPHYTAKTTFPWAGKVFRLSGYSPRSSKFPILGTDVLTGKVFKLPMRAVSAWVPDAFSYLL